MSACNRNFKNGGLLRRKALGYRNIKNNGAEMR